MCVCVCVCVHSYLSEVFGLSEQRVCYESGDEGQRERERERDGNESQREYNNENREEKRGKENNIIKDHRRSFIFLVTGIHIHH